MAPIDSETGEESYTATCSTGYDDETGEPTEQDCHGKCSPKRKFHVPQSYLQEGDCRLNPDPEPKIKVKKSHDRQIKESFPICGRKKMYGLQQDIMMGQHTTSHRLFLMLPILFIFPKWPTIVIAIFEVLVHIWAHKKNKLLSDRATYYRSPLHVITSEFCAYCKSEAAMNTIGKIQDQRKHNHLRDSYDCVARVVT